MAWGVESAGPLPLGIAWVLVGTYDHVLRILAVIPPVCAIVALFLTALDIPETETEMKLDGEPNTV